MMFRHDYSHTVIVFPAQQLMHTHPTGGRVPVLEPVVRGVYEAVSVAPEEYPPILERIHSLPFFSI